MKQEMRGFLVLVNKEADRNLSHSLLDFHLRWPAWIRLHDHILIILSYTLIMGCQPRGVMVQTKEVTGTYNDSIQINIVFCIVS